MTTHGSATAISDAITQVDLSSPSAAKWNAVYALLSTVFSLAEEALYVTYINKAANTQVRIAKQMPTERPVRLAIGVCGNDDADSRSYPAQASRAILSRPDLNCVVFFWEFSATGEPETWRPRVCYHRVGSSEAVRVSEIWPETQLIEVLGKKLPGAQQASTSSNPDATRTIIQLLERNKNVVLEGVPGTGKSFAIGAIKAQWHQTTGRQLAEPYVMVMHPSSSYEDLVEGLRPGTAIDDTSDFTSYPSSPLVSAGFLPRLGRFTSVCAAAAGDPGRDHLLVLDELNRANVPKTFGELLLVMEGTKRATLVNGSWEPPPDGVVHLTYTGTRFWIPTNLFILGTMNTTDRSVAPLDSALRRRFVFVRLEPMTADEVAGRVAPLPDEGAQTMFQLVLEAWAAINADLLRPVIGPDAMLGHSYMFDLHTTLMSRQGADAITATRDFLQYSLLPQLIDAATANGREADVFDPTGERLDDQATSAYQLLDALAEVCGLNLSLQGDSLARRVVIDLLAKPRHDKDGADDDVEGPDDKETDGPE